MDMINFFNGYAEHWDDDYKEDDRIRDAVAALCGAGPGKKVLDIACGTGVMFKELIRCGTESIVGVDLSDKMIDIARNKFKNEDKVKVICQDIMEFNEVGFDSALIFNAYPHFLNKDSLISHVAGLLNPNGRFTIAHNNGRCGINECHKNVPSNISSELQKAEIEAERFKKWFEIDILIDTPYCYMISGVVKK